MKSESKQQIADIINKKGKVSVHYLSGKLNLSPQMVHRHLKDLIQQGLVSRLGSAPKTEYQSLSNGPTKPLLNKDLSQQLEKCAEILSCHPVVKLVTLFGSQARGEAHQDSDIDLLVWISSGKESFSRHDIWNYFDRHSRSLLGKTKFLWWFESFKIPLKYKLCFWICPKNIDWFMIQETGLRSYAAPLLTGETDGELNACPLLVENTDGFIPLA